MVALPEEAGFPLAVEGAVPLTVKALLAEVDSEIAAAVASVLETETAVAVRQASVGAAPETAVGFFVGAAPVLDFEIVAVAVFAVVLVF